MNWLFQGTIITLLSALIITITKFMKNKFVDFYKNKDGKVKISEFYFPLLGLICGIICTYIESDFPKWCRIVVIISTIINFFGLCDGYESCYKRSKQQK